jgi:hypothetical protein
MAIESALEKVSRFGGYRTAQGAVVGRDENVSCFTNTRVSSSSAVSLGSSRCTLSSKWPLKKTNEGMRCYHRHPIEMASGCIPFLELYVRRRWYLQGFAKHSSVAATCYGRGKTPCRIHIPQRCSRPSTPLKATTFPSTCGRDTMAAQGYRSIHTAQTLACDSCGASACDGGVPALVLEGVANREDH